MFVYPVFRKCREAAHVNVPVKVIIPWPSLSDHNELMPVYVPTGEVRAPYLVSSKRFVVIM